MTNPPNKELAYEFIKYIAGARMANITTWRKPATCRATASVYKDKHGYVQIPVLRRSEHPEAVTTKPSSKCRRIKADKYGEDILSKWRKSAGDGITNNKSYDDVVKDFKKEVKNTFPEIDVN